jgi:hypothetical protein
MVVYRETSSSSPPVSSTYITTQYQLEGKEKKGRRGGRKTRRIEIRDERKKGRTKERERRRVKKRNGDDREERK